MSKRMTARNQLGQARLMPGVDIMDAIEALAKREEQELGPLTVAANGINLDFPRCRQCVHYHWESIGNGKCDRNPIMKDGERTGEFKLIAGAMHGCADWRERDAKLEK